MRMLGRIPQSVVRRLREPACTLAERIGQRQGAASPSVEVGLQLEVVARGDVCPRPAHGRLAQGITVPAAAEIDFVTHFRKLPWQRAQ
jgi:hypothetical protein